jgi:predicted TIM-barrel fold metal-dependent hydrolase
MSAKKPGRREALYAGLKTCTTRKTRAARKTCATSFDGALSRRQWLTGVTVLAATTITSARQAMAQAGASRPRIIDTHHHYSGDWIAAQAIEGMDQNRIAIAILSRPGIPVSEPEKARKLARDTNERGAQLVRDYPGRFGFFATLPLFDVEGSLREIAYAFETLKADGACIVTSYGDASGTKWIGDPAYAPVFDELNRRRAVVFVHPVVPSYYNDDFRLEKGSVRGTSGLNGTALENQFDTARAIMSVTINGTLVRCPDIRFIFSHGGGALPGLHERMDHQVGEDRSWRTDGSYHSRYVPNGFDHELRKLYFDLVRVVNPVNIAMLTALLPPEHLLFGSDYPPVAISETASRLPGLHLDGKLLRGIERDNALALFPRFKA